MAVIDALGSTGSRCPDQWLRLSPRSLDGPQGSTPRSRHFHFTRPTDSVAGQRHSRPSGADRRPGQRGLHLPRLRSYYSLRPPVADRCTPGAAGSRRRGSGARRKHRKIYRLPPPLRGPRRRETNRSQRLPARLELVARASPTNSAQGLHGSARGVSRRPRERLLARNHSGLTSVC
jgi:hypothetical protein